MVQLLITLGIVAVLIFGIMKKVNLPVLYLSISFFVLIGYSIVTGVSVLGEDTQGFMLVDVFEYLVARMLAAFTSTGFNVMFILGYIGFMDHIKATQYFALSVVKPLRKLRNPYIILGLIVIMGAFLKFVIGNAVSLASLLVATLSPVLLALGIPVTTVAMVMLVSVTAVWGPVDVPLFTMFSLIDAGNYTVPEFFVQYQLPIFLPAIAVLAVSTVFFSKYYDKKEKARGIRDEEVEGLEGISEGQTPESLGVPKYYWLLPLIPLVLVLVFSSMVTGIVISMAGAFLLGIFIVIVILCFERKSLKGGLNVFFDFIQGAAHGVALCGFSIMGAVTFANVVRLVGGFDVLAELLSKSSGLTFLIGLAALSTLAIALIPNVPGVVSILTPVVVSYSTATGVSPYPFLAVMTLALSYGYVFAPATAVMNFITPIYKKTPIDIMKRSIFPMLITLVVGVIIAAIVYY